MGYKIEGKHKSPFLRISLYTTVNPLTADYTLWHHHILPACYQLAQSVLKIGPVLAERVRQGGGGWVHRSG